MAHGAPSRGSWCGSRPAPGTSRRPDSSPSPPQSARRSRLRLAGLPGEKSGCLLEDLALHPQRLVLTTQARQLLTLVRAQPVRALARIALGLLDPVSQRDIRDPKILGDLTLRLARDPSQLDRLAAELLWIRRSGPRHISPPRPVFRRKRSGVLETGGTPG